MLELRRQGLIAGIAPGVAAHLLRGRLLHRGLPVQQRKRLAAHEKQTAGRQGQEERAGAVTSGRRRSKSHGIVLSVRKGICKKAGGRLARPKVIVACFLAVRQPLFYCGPPFPLPLPLPPPMLPTPTEILALLPTAVATEPTSGPSIRPRRS